MSRVHVAVLEFPGLNCEDETCRALRKAGVSASIVRWNESPGQLARFAGYVIPGGFSYQDRVRAGAVAAKSDLVGALAREVEGGKPVLGICNGAQILVEAGLVPGGEPGRVDVALARNRVPHREGYLARWVFVRPGREAPCFFTQGLEDPFPVPMAHAEGRFLSADVELRARLAHRERRTLFYCTPDGSEAEAFPDNPNGSPGALAGLAGLDGQALAFMPHPERASWLWQVPEDLPGPWGARRREAMGDFGGLAGAGPGLALLRAFARLGTLEAV